MPKRAWVQSRVLNRLREQEGGTVKLSELIEAAYPNPDDQPDYADESIRIAVKKLRVRGYPIKTEWAFGYRFVPSIQEIAPDALDLRQAA